MHGQADLAYGGCWFPSTSDRYASLHSVGQAQGRQEGHLPAFQLYQDFGHLFKGLLWRGGKQPMTALTWLVVQAEGLMLWLGDARPGQRLPLGVMKEKQPPSYGTCGSTMRGLISESCISAARGSGFILPFGGLR